MTQIRLPDEINQLADQIKIGERFRTCDIHSKLKHRRCKGTDHPVFCPKIDHDEPEFMENEVRE